MVVGLMDWLSPETDSLDKIIVTSATPWEQWFGKANAELRSTTATLPWLKRQLNGEFLDTLKETFIVLSTPSKLKFCGFLFPTKTSMFSLKPEEH